MKNGLTLKPSSRPEHRSRYQAEKSPLRQRMTRAKAFAVVNADKQGTRPVTSAMLSLALAFFH